ncbi:MAG: general secretion pathway protein GspK [bacterium]|nr:general secretion pathway protein GspK [bacterium]
MRARDEEGVVLLLVIVLIVVTISTVYAMAATSTLEIMGTRYRIERTRADLLAKSAMPIAMRALHDDLSVNDALAQVVESGQDGWALLGEQPIVVEGGGGLDIRVLDIGSKININAMIDVKGEPIGEQSRSFLKAALRQIIDSTPALLEESSYTDEKVNNLTDGILDWIDKNDQTRLGTPEEEFWVAIEKAEVPPADRPLFSLDELAPIPGMGPLLLEAMKSYFTTYPMFPPPGTGGINLNTAPAHVLGLLYHGTALDSEFIKERDILEVMRAREEGRVFCPSQADERCIGVSEVLGVVRQGEIFFPQIQFKSDVFRIEVEARYGETRSCLASVVDRSRPAENQTLYYRLGC